MIKDIGRITAKMPRTKVLVKAELRRWLNDNSELFLRQEVMAIEISGKFVPIEKINNPSNSLLICQSCNKFKVIFTIQLDNNKIKTTPIKERKIALIISFFLTNTKLSDPKESLAR
jgi:hypothetical protein